MSQYLFEPGSDSGDMHTKIGCEGANMELNCQFNYVIVVEHVTWGRTNKTVCMETEVDNCLKGQSVGRLKLVQSDRYKLLY